MTKGLDSGEVAGWVQAIGATIGIGIAIWLPYKQNEDASKAAKAQQRENTKRVCLSLMDELSTLRKSLRSEMYVDMLTINPEKSFDFSSPSREFLFPVYKAMAGQLIEVDSSETRQAVIEAYASHSDLFDVLEINDRVLDQSWKHYLYRTEEKQRIGRLDYDLIESTFKGRLLGLRASIHEQATLLVSNVDHAIKLLKIEAAEPD